MKVNLMSKIWIDITELLINKDKLTDIAKVVYELAIRLDNCDKDINFFIYDVEKKYCYQTTLANFKNDSASKDISKTKEAKTKKIFQIKNLKLFNKIYKKHNSNEYKVIFNFQSQNCNLTSPFNNGDVIVVMGSTKNSIMKMRDLINLKHILNLKYVQIIYDVIPTFYPQLFEYGLASQFDNSLFEVMAGADLLFCFSKEIQNELLKFCKITRIDPPRMKLIRGGDDYLYHNQPIKPKVILSEDEPFIICINSLGVRGNQYILYYVVKEAINRGIDVPKIIIAGLSESLSQDLIYILNNDKILGDRLQYLGDITNEEKIWLYQNCSFTINPSIVEGWGYSIAQSLHYGKPCLSSNILSMREIGGNLVDYFSPYDSGKCLEKIVEFGNSNELGKRAKLIRESYKSVTWDQTIFKIITALKNL